MKDARAEQQGRKRQQAMLALVLLCLGTAPALADPRSDALAGAARCQSIADDRTFLNCVYGAMQPLRSELGLAPAPPAQTMLVPPATLPMTPPPVSRATPPRGEGMLGGLLGSGKNEIVPQRLAAFSFDTKGFFTVTLTDGSVWKQLDGDSARAHWHGRPSDLTVAIRAGAFGAHVLQLRGESAIYKVIRIR
jgi:hypothetical protein